MTASNHHAVLTLKNVWMQMGNEYRATSYRSSRGLFLCLKQNVIYHYNTLRHFITLHKIQNIKQTDCICFRASFQYHTLFSDNLPGSQWFSFEIQGTLCGSICVEKEEGFAHLTNFLFFVGPYAKATKHFFCYPLNDDDSVWQSSCVPVQYKWTMGHEAAKPHC